VTVADVAVSTAVGLRRSRVLFDGRWSLVLDADSPQSPDLWPDIDLSPMEGALLAYLTASVGRVVSSEELLREVWGYHPRARSTTVKTTVRRVRQKIEPEPARPRHLITLRGRGYQLIPRRRPDTERAVVLRRGPPTSPATEPTRFVGRQQDLEQLERMLAEDRRLVTIHGGPGLGKTRLARQLAAHLAERYPAGIWMCDLSHTTGVEQAFGVVAAALGIVRPPEAGASVVEALMAVLRRRGRTLLVLDNVEQLPSAAHQVLPRLLGHCPSTQVVVTSRVRLNVSGEALHEVGPLSLDEGASLLRDRIEAIRIDRAQPLEAEVLRDIVQILEGVPLALEMAAARARVLPLRELRSRLRVSFGVLAAQRSDRPSRQQTLHDAIAWSWRLLSDDEASALVQFGAFRGGCSLEVAEEVIDARPGPLDAITALLDKSMLRTWRAHGQLRLGPYESVREFVVARGGGELEAARARHARWAVRAASRWAADFDTEPTAGPSLSRELDNLLSAAGWLITHSCPEAADLLWCLRHIYYARRQPADFPRWLHKARDTLRLTRPQASRIHLALARSYGFRQEGALMQAEVERGLARVGPTDPIRADLMLTRARVCVRQGDHHQAAELAQQALASAERHGTEEGLPRHLNVLGMALQKLDRHAESVAVFRRAIRHADETGAARLAATVWSNLAVSYRTTGDFHRGLDCLRHAQELAQLYDEPRLVHWVKAQMAPLHAHLGELTQADALFREVLATDADLDQSNIPAATRVNAGIVALLCEDLPRATAVLEAARSQLRELGTADASMGICLSSLVVCRSSAADLEGAEQTAMVLAALDLAAMPRRIQLQIEISLGHLDLLRSRRAEEQGHRECAARHREAAEHRLRHGASDRDSPSLAVVRRLLERALAR